MPFVGEVLHYVECQEIVIERILDLREDLFLAHHTLVQAENVKPPSHCLPVMPMALIMELMAEAAACLSPTSGLLGFEKVQVKHWVRLENTVSLPLRISARLDYFDYATGTSSIVVHVFTDREQVVNAQGTVLLGKRYSVSLDLEFSEPQNIRPYPLAAKKIYGQRRVFHGPLFQTLDGLPILADRAISGELTILPKSGMFRSNAEPALLTDPIAVDGISQLVVLWGIDRDVYAYPIGVQNLELYCAPPPSGVRVPVYAQIGQFSNRFLDADLEIQDGSGHVWMRVRGWRAWVYYWPKRLYNFNCNPTWHCLSHALTQPGLPDGAVARWITKDDLRDCDLRECAHRYLHIHEMDAFHKLSNIPAQQTQWLLDRIAVKDAVRRWLVPEEDREMLHPAAFTIANDAREQPFVQDLPGAKQIPAVNLTHAADRAFAVAHTSIVDIGTE